MQPFQHISDDFWIDSDCVGADAVDVEDNRSVRGVGRLLVGYRYEKKVVIAGRSLDPRKEVTARREKHWRDVRTRTQPVPYMGMLLIFRYAVCVAQADFGHAVWLNHRQHPCPKVQDGGFNGIPARIRGSGMIDYARIRDLDELILRRRCKSKRWGGDARRRDHRCWLRPGPNHDLERHAAYSLYLREIARDELIQFSRTELNFKIAVEAYLTRRLSDRGIRKSGVRSGVQGDLRLFANQRILWP